MAEEPSEQFKELARGLALAYQQLSDDCQLLPIPIGLPDPRQDEVGMDDMRLAVHHAVTAVGDLPLDDLLSSVLGQALVQWIAAGRLIEVFEALKDSPSYMAAGFTLRACLAGSLLAHQMLTEQQE